MAKLWKAAGRQTCKVSFNLGKPVVFSFWCYPFSCQLGSEITIQEHPTSKLCRLWSCPFIRIHGSEIAIPETPTFNKRLGQTAPSAWKCPKTQSWGPLTENLNPLQGPTHTLTLSSINTQIKKTTYGFIMACIELSDTEQNSLSHWKARIWLSFDFEKDSRHTH